MTDLASRSLIVFKGLLFLSLAVGAAYLVFEEAPSLKVALLLGVVAWASARFYYFLFYVLERYVDSSLRYAGIGSLVHAIIKRSRAAARPGA